MQPFTYARPNTLDEALHLAAIQGAAILAGGTTMIDLMRGDLAGPSSLVDIGHLQGIADVETSDETIRLGALVRMADAAEHPHLREHYPALTESLQLAASQQLRNAATLGGNILQRTRCPYFRDGVSACNKRTPGAGCTALDGEHRDMALFGTSDSCIATYPGDFATALAAFDTTLEIRSGFGTRLVPFAGFHPPYGKDPAVETILRPGEIITAILIQPTPAGRRSTYLKVRDRQSYAYALVSAAVALEMDGDTIIAARVALGGVASTPWRSPEAEAKLAGRRLSEEVALEAGAAAFAAARARRQNGFKVELGRRVVARAALVAGAKQATVFRA